MELYIRGQAKRESPQLAIRKSTCYKVSQRSPSLEEILLHDQTPVMLLSIIDIWHEGDQLVQPNESEQFAPEGFSLRFRFKIVIKICRKTIILFQTRQK
jgi:hypothetical protein